jgi:hypothetical protein
MLKSKLEIFCGRSISNAEFEVIMGMAKSDVYVNRVGFNKRTSQLHMLEIAEQCANLYFRMAGVA